MLLVMIAHLFTTVLRLLLQKNLFDYAHAQTDDFIDDEIIWDSNSVVNQESICQGGIGSFPN